MLKKWIVVTLIGGVAIAGIGAATPLGSTVVWQSLKGMINQNGKFTKLDFADGTSQTTAGGGAGVSDHGALTGLADDDHTQYMRESVFDTNDNGVADSTDELPTTGTMTTSLAVGTTTDCPANVNFNAVGTSTLDAILVGTNTVPLDCKSNLAGTTSVQRIRFLDGSIATSTTSFAGGSGMQAATYDINSNNVVDSTDELPTVGTMTTSLAVGTTTDCPANVNFNVVGTATFQGSLFGTSTMVAGNEITLQGDAYVSGTTTSEGIRVGSLIVDDYISIPAGTETINGNHAIDVGTNTLNLIGTITANGVNIRQISPLFAKFGTRTAFGIGESAVWTVTIPAGTLGTGSTMRYMALFTGTSTNATRGFRVTVTDGSTISTIAQGTITNNNCWGINKTYSDQGGTQTTVASGVHIINGGYANPLNTNFNFTQNTCTVSFRGNSGTTLSPHDGTVTLFLDDAMVEVIK